MNIFLKSLLFLTIVYFIINLTVNKYNIFKSKFYNKHQKLIGQEFVPQIGGFIFLIYIIFFYSKFDNTIIIFSIPIFFIGIFSDINFLTSPNKRLLFQFFVLLIFLYFYEYGINDVRIEYLNSILKNFYINLFFTLFCILIILNGSNFIDGTNGLNLGYFLSILIIILYLALTDSLYVDIQKIYILVFVIFFLLLINFFNFIYLGDSGAYLVSFIVSSVLIKLHNDNPNISPYFIALLLWYPAFENFFSIIRKKLVNSSPLDPDTNHLHQLIYKFLIMKKIRNIYANQFTSIIIVFYNLIIFILSINSIYETYQMIFLLSLNVIIYLCSYKFLKIALQK